MSRDKSHVSSFLEMFGGSESDTDNDPALPTREAQRDFLSQLATRAMRDLAPFQRGEFVSYLEGTGPLKKFARDGMVLMFWCYLDMENASDVERLSNSNQMERVMFPDRDCIVAAFLGTSYNFIYRHRSYSKERLSNERRHARHR
jgi:hypothetical protein